MCALGNLFGNVDPFFVCLLIMNFIAFFSLILVGIFEVHEA